MAARLLAPHLTPENQPLLRCKRHNGYEASLFFGADRPKRVREAPAVYGGDPTAVLNASGFPGDGPSPANVAILVS